MSDWLATYQLLMFGNAQKATINVLISAKKFFQVPYHLIHTSGYEYIIIWEKLYILYTSTW